MCGRLSWTHSAFESTSNSTIVPYRIVSYGFSYEVNSAVSSYSPHLVLALQIKPEMRMFTARAQSALLNFRNMNRQDSVFVAQYFVEFT